MIMLAVSTSAKVPSAALLMQDGSILLREDLTNRPHSVSLMPLIDALLDEAGLSVSDVELFAVDVGPGSFTGVRIGVSAVNAMAFALNKPIVPVSSLCALRRLAQTEKGTVLTLLDCRNGNGYAAVFEDGACTLEPCACVQSELLAGLGKDYAVYGDCLGRADHCSAELVIKEALAMLASGGMSCAAASSVPLYLRPSQAERMKQQCDAPRG